ncbi:MAG: aminoacyltransferase, partial [Anaerolineales bacterium]|nr:aminoacyltransferase [Anaerolineales bacterium]
MAVQSWNQLISSLKNPHLLQTSQWAAVKRQYGWVSHYLVWHSVEDELDLIISVQSKFEVKKPAAAALVLERKIFPGLSVLYVPKGPLLGDWSDEALKNRVLNDLEIFARKVGAIQIKIDPDVVVGRGVPGEDGSGQNSTGLAFQDQLIQHGWRYSSDQIQFRNTV